MQDFSQPSSIIVTQSEQPSFSPSLDTTTSETTILEAESNTSDAHPIIAFLAKKEKSKTTPTSRKKLIKIKKPKLIPNPKYAAEEFTYVPDPEEINENEINETDYNDQLLNLTKSKTPLFIENFDNLRNINFKLTEDNENVVGAIKVESNSVKLVKCDQFDKTGYCKLTKDYPKNLFNDLLENCKEILSSFRAFVPENIDELGDNSESVISSEKDHDRPWSWTVSAYKKKQVCESDLAFIRPSYALDTKGKGFIN